MEAEVIAETLTPGPSPVRGRGEKEVRALDAIFRPRSVAVIGASPWQFGAGGAGAMYLHSLKEMGCPAIYPVNPKHEEIEGFRCYPSLAAIEGPVDHVISALPARAVPGIVGDCIAKGVRTLHLFTAGFKETGDEAMADAETEIVAEAARAGIRVLGPNCMGLYVPSSGLSFIRGFPTEHGPVAMTSQSGTNAGEFVRGASRRGIRFSKVISYGNASDIDESELLEYLADDAESEIVTCYIEGVKDGRRFFQALKRAASAKPVLVLKGGRTESGQRATMSHTGSLAGSAEVFAALCRQAGALQVRNLDEMIDLSIAFRFGGAATGSRVALVAGGGGISVAAADEIDDTGLLCPPLPEATQQKLLEFIPAAGSSVRNPIDAFVSFDPTRLGDTVRIAGEADNIDAVIVQMDFTSPGFAMSPAAAEPEKAIAALVDAIVQASAASGKPPIIVSQEKLDVDSVRHTAMFQERCWQAGMPVYPTAGRAAAATARLLNWKAVR
jgi:acyl-CoA synthetase (NDP forming)